MKLLILLLTILVTNLQAETMLEQFKKYLSEKNNDSLLTLIKNDPQILDSTDKNGTSGLMLIVYTENDSLLNEAIKYKTEFSFHEAIVCGKSDIVLAQLKGHPEMVNKYSPDGFPPLALAAFFNQTEIALHLLELGADPNLQADNPSKVNALHSAVARENYELCKKLVEKGINVNAGQTQNVTALHSAAHRGNLKIVKLLIESGANISAKMDSGETPLDFAIKDGHNEVADYLRSHGAE